MNQSLEDVEDLDHIGIRINCAYQAAGVAHMVYGRRGFYSAECGICYTSSGSLPTKEELIGWQDTHVSVCPGPEVSNFLPSIIHYLVTK